ncbi:hypothetical protein KFE25_001762 [Diacronema lutheri]|uniref:BolA-like protein n=1 Tax=Diacronema lutheri TaxID=2081491 RepID=A0A7R9UIJ4_DIALT|nr:hypothetical protein KFE25_001762 [Diacronema lutheri]|mmetsp:Transcript_12224/g.38598  ORF Transcript_12224/g.38598 Transcript_12224/m.38598 type:complete len:136 (+) Transcript_12224:27-434(+)
MLARLFVVASVGRPVGPTVTARVGPGRWLTPSAFRPGASLLTRMSTSAGEANIPLQCQAKIKAGLGASQVEVQAAFDDPNGSHIAIFAVSSSFEGKSAMQRQQLVYKFIWEELQGPVHAVDKMVLKTPAEAAEGK